MISLITGIPGSGKSYRAVYEINEILQKNQKNFLIVSNIEGLNVEDNRLIHQDIDNKEFFFKDDFKQYINDLREKYRLCVSDMIYFYIDEPQRFLPPRLADEKVFASFEMHRHYGVDIFLITQDKRKIPLPISCLAENEVRAVNPKFSIVPNCFNYNHFCGDYITGKSVLKKDKNIFKLYQSFLGGMPKKYTNSYVFILFGLILCLIAFVYFFIGSFSTGEKPSHPAPRSSSAPVAPAAAPAAVAPVAPAAAIAPVTPAAALAPVVPPAAPPVNDFDGIVIVEANFRTSTFFCDVYGNLLHISFDDFFRMYSPVNYHYSFMKSDSLLLLNINGFVHRLDKKSTLFEPLVIEKKKDPVLVALENTKQAPIASAASGVPTSANPAAAPVTASARASPAAASVSSNPVKIYRDVLSHELEKQIFLEFIKK